MVWEGGFGKKGKEKHENNSRQAGAELCQAQDKLGVACLQLKLKEGVVNKGTNGINLLKQIWSWSSGFG